MKVNGFARNVKAIRENAGLNQHQFAEIVGVTNVTVSKWEVGKTSYPGDKCVIDKIKETFDVSDQDLFGYTDGFYTKYHNLVPSLEAKPSDSYAPVLGNIAAGDPREAIETDGETHWVRPDLLEKYPDGFFLRISGDSMDRLLPDGCYAFVAPMEVLNGDIAAVKVNGDEATVKQIKFLDGIIVLVPASNNTTYKRRVIDSTDPDAPQVRILGKVIWFDCEV